jgi:hypothetical protein
MARLGPGSLLGVLLRMNLCDNRDRHRGIASDSDSVTVTSHGTEYLAAAGPCPGDAALTQSLSQDVNTGPEANPWPVSLAVGRCQWSLVMVLTGPAQHWHRHCLGGRCGF